MNRRRIKKAIRRIAKLPMNRYLFFYCFNKLKQMYYKLVKSTKVAYPSTVMLELTNHCNLLCTTCARQYDFGKAMDKGMIEIDQAKKIVDEIWPYLDSIGLTGLGETFLFNDILDIAEYIKSKNKGIIISLSTNANFPSFIEKVKPVIGIIDTIQISVDGLGDVYERIRINGKFEQLDSNLRELVRLNKNSKTDLMINMVVTKENYHHMSALVKYAGEVGIKYLDFTLFNLASVTNIDESYYSFYESKEFFDVLDELDSVEKETENVYVTNKNFKTDNSFQKCYFPWNNFYMCWNGYVVPCCGKPFPKELHFGNVFTDGVLNVLNSDDYQSFRRLWFLNKEPDFCKKCHFINIK